MTRKKKASNESDSQRGHASQKGGADRRLGEQHGQCAGLDREKAGSGHGRRHRDEADRGEGDAGDRQSPGKLAERQQPGVMPLPFPKPIEAEKRKPEEQSQIAIKREARSNDEPVIHVSAHREDRKSKRLNSSH